MVTQMTQLCIDCARTGSRSNLPYIFFFVLLIIGFCTGVPGVAGGCGGVVAVGVVGAAGVTGTAGVTGALLGAVEGATLPGTVGFVAGVFGDTGATPVPDPPLLASGGTVVPAAAIGVFTTSSIGCNLFISACVFNVPLTVN